MTGASLNIVAPSNLVLPAAPRSWYLVGRSRDLPPRRVITWDLLDQQIVLFRGSSGRVTALDAHCAHMGAHLVHGEVIGDHLRCALHHWLHDSSGRCRGPQGACLQQRTYPVVEQYGGIFVFADTSPDYALPSIDDRDGAVAHVAMGKSAMVHASWPGLAANAFDVAHMLAVHRRALRQPPEVTRLGAHGVELRYVSRVVGSGLSDRLMKQLSGDEIRVSMRCWGGTIITVRSEVGSRIGRLFLTITPTTRGATVTLFVGVARGPFDTVAARISLWLFTAFLRRDLVPIHNMNFRIEGALASPGPLSEVANWMLTLPPAAIGARR